MSEPIDILKIASKRLFDAQERWRMTQAMQNSEAAAIASAECMLDLLEAQAAMRSAQNFGLEISS